MRLVRRGNCLLKQARTSAQRVAKRLFVVTQEIRWGILI